MGTQMTEETAAETIEARSDVAGDAIPETASAETEAAPQEESFTLPDAVKVCPVCKTNIQKYPLASWGDYEYISCNSCGSVMVDPPVTQAEIDRFFGDVQPEIVHVVRHEKVVEKMRKLLEKNFPDRKGKTFLDVGFGRGYVVAAAKDLGFKSVKGIDPYEFHLAFARKYYEPELFEQVTLADYVDRGEQADIVVSLHNICEQPDPAGYVQALAKIVPKGGKVFFEEPDGNSFFLPRRFERWAYLEPPINSIFVSRKGLTALLKENGFKITKRFFTWSPFDRFIATKVR